MKVGNQLVAENGANITGEVSVTGDVSTTGKVTAVQNMYAPAFIQTSDHRLKKDVRDISPVEAWELIKKLHPIHFKFLDSESEQEGFLAHEFLQSAVEGIKDQVDEEGNIIPQRINYIMLIPWLVATIQELQRQIQVLNNRQKKLK